MYAKITIFFPENEQLKQGNYLHCFGKKKISKSEHSDFFLILCGYIKEKVT